MVFFKAMAAKLLKIPTTKLSNKINCRSLIWCLPRQMVIRSKIVLMLCFLQFADCAKEAQIYSLFTNNQLLKLKFDNYFLILNYLLDSRDC